MLPLFHLLVGLVEDIDQPIDILAFLLAGEEVDVGEFDAWEEGDWKFLFVGKIFDAKRVISTHCCITIHSLVKALFGVLVKNSPIFEQMRELKVCWLISCHLEMIWSWLPYISQNAYRWTRGNTTENCDQYQCRTQVLASWPGNRAQLSSTSLLLIFLYKRYNP